MSRPETITDEQIQGLHARGLIDDDTYRGAILVATHHGSLGRGIRRECRARCAEIFNARIGKKG